ncbi:MAG: hypothetical protein ACRDGN_17270 [bacterium]
MSRLGSFTSTASLAVIVAIAIVGCARRASETLEPYTSERHGFSITRPSSWERIETEDGNRVWFLPQAPAAGELPEAGATEFIVVMTRQEAGPLAEGEVRRLAMSLLLMHGVSGFARTAESTEQIVWYRFELTGSTRGREWASVGLLVTGPQRLHYTVCAAPLSEWAAKQKRCDAVLRSFRIGDLTR